MLLVDEVLLVDKVVLVDKVLLVVEIVVKSVLLSVVADVIVGGKTAFSVMLDVVVKLESGKPGCPFWGAGAARAETVR